MYAAAAKQKNKKKKTKIDIGWSLILEDTQYKTFLEIVKIPEAEMPLQPFCLFEALAR